MTVEDAADHRSWIGRSMQAVERLDQRLVGAYRATLEPHLAPVGADEAPLGIHWCLAPVLAPMAELGPDGHAAKGGFLPPVPLPRRMWAGGQIETFAPMMVGDEVTRASTVTDVSYKSGRTGPLCFVSVEHRYTSRGRLAVRERHDIVYRGLDQPKSGPSEGSQQELRPADAKWEIETDPVLLFRYSALTFNSHRIHYDYPYVTQVEGYPGLVVHGPLQATLLFNAAARLGNGAPMRFVYRAVSPLFAGETLSICAARISNSQVETWSEGTGGQVHMTSVSTW